MNRALSTAFGLVMVAAVSVQADDAALIAAGLATVAVLTGNVFRSAATMAVLLTAAALVLNETPAMLAALSGLCAACYLVLRHTATITAPTVIGAVGFTAVGLAAVSLPLELPWAPLLAPLSVLGLVALVTRPFWADRTSR
ncbi:hypothetical protein [Mycolicibacterium moriokaense]|uniref:Integral membrane protein n=1 Tax=Mycolicibacterium moriokaense TaxID=39691 RepID=A0AAD1M3U9_9MYCO|nr:hypothetical protein [Mycolicibacterium moriokaense]BBW99417.1 hypothetical protein MMOR_03540 [Mycolicibacterium moriokaense]